MAHTVAVITPTIGSPDRSAFAGMILKFSILVFFIHSKKESFFISKS